MRKSGLGGGWGWGDARAGVGVESGAIVGVWN
jgi:hypothetical protein